MNPETGLFFFDSSYRPVPLAQQYIGISEPNFAARNELLSEVCYKKVTISFELFLWCFKLESCVNCIYSLQVVDSLRRGHQAMVFVHSRKDTAKTAEKLVQLLKLLFLL